MRLLLAYLDSVASAASEIQKEALTSCVRGDSNPKPGSTSVSGKFDSSTEADTLNTYLATQAHSIEVDLQKSKRKRKRR